MLSYVLKGVKLRDYQVRAMIHVAESNTQMIAFDTGLGKTMAIIAGLVAKRNKGHRVRVLYLSPLRGLEQVKQTFKKHTNFRVTSVSGAEKVKAVQEQIDTSADVVLVNYEAFDNPNVLELIHYLNQAKFFTTVVADEAHTFANIYTSNRNFFISTIFTSIPYRYILTATPIISKQLQYASLLALMYNDLNNLGSIHKRVKAGAFTHDKVPHIIQYQERKVGYKVQLHVLPEQKTARAMYGMEVFRYTRGAKIKPVEDRMRELIRNGGEKLLIFAHLKENHQYLKSLAESEGRRVGIISGDRPHEKVQKDFNAGHLDCVVFSVPTALNLPASNIIMYDWTNLAHQAIGRGIRSEEVGDYTAHFILTKTEKELSLFKNTVIKSTVFLSESFGKDIEPLLNLREDV